jgi:hypothetical protein
LCNNQQQESGQEEPAGGGQQNPEPAPPDDSSKGTGGGAASGKVYRVGDAGEVELRVENGRPVLVEVRPNAGWNANVTREGNESNGAAPSSDEVADQVLSVIVEGLQI